MRQTILITGASRGIGRATALSFTDTNLNIVVNYEKEEQKAKEVVDLLRQRGLNAIAIQADVSDVKQVNRMFDEIEDRFGPVDILINNAGIAEFKLAQDVSYEGWHRMFDVNIHAHFYTVKRAIPQMISKKKGVIVNVASIWGETGGSMESHYSATKGAIMSYTKALARELGPSGIRVNTISPGAIYTDMISHLGQDVLDAFTETVPLGRLGRPEEVAELIKFIVSDKASYITGQIISINGGANDR